MHRKSDRPRFSEDKVEIRAPHQWVDRVDAEADRLGLKRSAYIRMVVTQALEAAEARRLQLVSDDIREK